LNPIWNPSDPGASFQWTAAHFIPLGVIKQEKGTRIIMKKKSLFLPPHPPDITLNMQNFTVLCPCSCPVGRPGVLVPATCSPNEVRGFPFQEAKIKIKQKHKIMLTNITLHKHGAKLAKRYGKVASGPGPFLHYIISSFSLAISHVSPTYSLACPYLYLPIVVLINMQLTCYCPAIIIIIIIVVLLLCIREKL